jgi:hypothetical protein
MHTDKRGYRLKNLNHQCLSLSICGLLNPESQIRFPSNQQIFKNDEKTGK